MHVLDEAVIAELPNYYRGKVRENYDLPDGRRIIIATDRLSAFDRILTCVPHKGRVLTQIARYWFEQTAHICPNHVIAYPDPNVVLARRLDILPVEIVVRGYLAGTTGTSLLSLYKKGERRIYGLSLPDGMQDNQILPEPVITPTSKAFDGGHDAPLTPDEILDKGLLTHQQWRTVSAHALALFAHGQRATALRGLILADTKYEFGLDKDGTIVLADEIHTPDSSRFWLADSYAEAFRRGERPASFDKDFIRAWVTERCDPYKDDLPAIPEDLVLRASKLYIDAYERITGEKFMAQDMEVAPLERVRNNLKPYFAAG